MPICISCGSHYKTTKEFNDPLECEDCAGVVEDNYDEYPDDISIEEISLGDGCTRKLPVYVD